MNHEAIEQSAVPPMYEKQLTPFDPLTHDRTELLGILKHIICSCAPDQPIHLVGPTSASSQ